MDSLTAFGLFAVTAMLVCYALERRSRWFVLLFAFSCALGSVYGFLQGAWPFGLVEAIWSVVALRRWITAPLLHSWAPQVEQGAQEVNSLRSKPKAWVSTEGGPEPLVMRTHNLPQTFTTNKSRTGTP